MADVTPEKTEEKEEAKPILDNYDEIGGGTATSAPAEVVEEVEDKEKTEETEVKEETPVEEAKKEEPEKKEEKPPVVEAKKDDKPVRDIRQERTKIKEKLQGLRNQLASKDALDSMDDGKLLKELNETILEDALLQHEAHDLIDKEVVDKQREQEEAAAYWDKWNTDHPDVDLAEAQDAWDEAVLAASKKYKSRDGVQAVANEKFEAAIDAIKTRLAKEKAEAEAAEAGEDEDKPKNLPPRQVPTKTKAAAAPVTAGGARVTPAGVAPSRSGVQRELTVREQIERGMVDLSPFNSVLND